MPVICSNENFIPIHSEPILGLIFGHGLSLRWALLALSNGQPHKPDGLTTDACKCQTWPDPRHTDRHTRAVTTAAKDLLIVGKCDRVIS